MVLVMMMMIVLMLAGAPPSPSRAEGITELEDGSRVSGPHNLAEPALGVGGKVFPPGQVVLPAHVDLDKVQVPVQIAHCLGLIPAYVIDHHFYGGVAFGGIRTTR